MKKAVIRHLNRQIGAQTRLYLPLKSRTGPLSRPLLPFTNTSYTGAHIARVFFDIYADVHIEISRFAMRTARTAKKFISVFSHLCSFVS